VSYISLPLINRQSSQWFVHILSQFPVAEQQDYPDHRPNNFHPHEVGFTWWSFPTRPLTLEVGPFGFSFGIKLKDGFSEIRLYFSRVYFFVIWPAFPLSPIHESNQEIRIGSSRSQIRHIAQPNESLVCGSHLFFLTETELKIQTELRFARFFLSSLVVDPLLIALSFFLDKARLYPTFFHDRGNDCLLQWNPSTFIRTLRQR